MSNAVDFVIENGVLTKYTGPGGNVVIPEGVTVIGEQAFYGCESLRSVTIPEGVTTIEKSAFFCCSLRSVTIPGSVTTIGKEAFSYCERLTDITILEGVTTIEDGAFERCGKLTGVTIPEGVTIIGKRAFSGCGSLRSVMIPKSVTTIKGGAFFCCSRLTSVTIPEGVTIIGAWAFCDCSSLSSVAIPESVTSIEEEAFADCNKLARFGPLSSGCKLGKNPFGKALPKGLYSCVDSLYPLFTDGMLKQYLLTRAVWTKLDSGLQTEIFMSRQGKTLMPAYEKCVKDPDVLGKNILDRLSGKSSAKECGSAASFMMVFSQVASAEILWQLYEALKPLKTAAKALKTIESDALLNRKLNGEAAAAKPLSPSEETVMRILQKEQKSMTSLTKMVKQFYGLEVSTLPKVACTDGAQAPEPAMAYLLTVHEKLQEQTWQEQPDVAASYQKPGVCKHAAEVLALLDQKSFQSALLALADANLGLSGRSKKMFLAYPICRYADEALMAELTKRAPKWASSVSGNDAPPLRTFRKAVLYSETRAAMLFADKFGELDRYAEIRGTDADTIRDQFLSDVGLDETGGKTYNLGNQTVTARLQKDLSFLVELPTGKTAKSLPKKGADPEKYAVANADFSEMKKNAKKIVKNRVSILLGDFLSGRTRTADAWKESYLKNPLLRQVGSLLVWAQDGNTFLLTDTGAVTADGAPYSIGNTEIALAHPMEMTGSNLTAWQKHFTANGIKQPFAQVWEPVINPAAIHGNRYQGVLIPYFRFMNQARHGIYVTDEAFHDEISISFDECDAIVERIDWASHSIDPNHRFEVKQFGFTKYTRQVNHIVGLLDKWTVYGRILNDDTSITEQLPQFTLAQITEFIKVAAENNCTNVTALLLDYQAHHFADFDAMAEFTLEEL